MPSDILTRKALSLLRCLERIRQKAPRTAKALKADLEAWFDHKTVVAADDPKLTQFRSMETQGMLQLTIMKNDGCESFAEFAYGLAVQAIADLDRDGRITVLSCEVREHGANSAIYKPFA